MRLLFVHDRFSALAGAEANLLHTANELKHRGHAIGILHGRATGQGEDAWRQTFSERFAAVPGDNAGSVERALRNFRPEAIYVHKMADLGVIEAILAAGVPVVRMVHDHDLYCMRSCKYHYFSRRICTRAASPYCTLFCGAFLARNHGAGFPLRWVSYAAKKKEIRINRQFQKLIVNSH